MGEEIKSALEIAMEKVEKMGGVTEEERLRWKYVPEGERLGARYLKEDTSLLAELGKFGEAARKQVIKGMSEVLIRNIGLPTNAFTRKTNRKAMDGLKAIKTDKSSVENVYSRMRRVFDHYAEQGEQQKKQAYESLKAEFEARIQEAMKQQLGTTVGIKIDVESQPQFQEEWHRLQARLDTQYATLLDEYKQELAAIS